MKKTENINIRITPELKKNIEEVLQKENLKTTDLIRSFLEEIEKNKTIPKKNDDINYLFKKIQLESKETISILRDQLKEKDKQLEKKDKLLENMQVLLKKEQEKNILFIQGKNNSWWKFWKKDKNI